MRICVRHDAWLGLEQQRWYPNAFNCLASVHPATPARTSPGAAALTAVRPFPSPTACIRPSGAAANLSARRLRGARGSFRLGTENLSVGVPLTAKESQKVFSLVCKAVVVGTRSNRRGVSRRFCETEESQGVGGRGPASARPWMAQP